MLSACSGYKAGFEACLVDLGGIEKHNFPTALAQSVTAWCGSPSILTRLLHSAQFWTGCCGYKAGFEACLFCRNCNYYKFETIQHCGRMTTASPKMGRVEKPCENWRVSSPPHYIGLNITPLGYYCTVSLEWFTTGLWEENAHINTRNTYSQADWCKNFSFDDKSMRFGM